MDGVACSFNLVFEMIVLELAVEINEVLAIRFFFSCQLEAIGNLFSERQVVFSAYKNRSMDCRRGSLQSSVHGFTSSLLSNPTERRRDRYHCRWTCKQNQIATRLWIDLVT